MSLLISSQNLKKSYGGRTLFSDLSFGIFQKDKIGLIGPNGSGKSTLLKILAGLDEADEGIIAKNRSTKVGYVPQDTLFGEKSLIEVLLEPFEKQSTLSEEEKQTRIAKILSKFGFEDATKQANTLSGGWQKRLAIAKELVTEPDVLLLDEPTNHLDLEGVIWLENFLKNIPTAYVVISHDRYFLEHITTRMWELDKTYPKGILTIDGSYSNFIEKKEEFLSGQLQQERSLNSKVRREMEWLKQNPKARTTKSTSRIQSAHALIQELQELKTRNTTGKSQIDFTSSKKDSQKLVVATNLTQTMGEKKLFEGVDFTLTPGTRLGLVGLNGSGKTTLLKLIAGEITPDKGSIKYADKIKIVYFDQHRAQLPSDISLKRALSPEGDTVIYKGQSIHVNSWCRRFLFAPDRLDLPFGQLSGGEKARVHIARLMLKPADVLLLDEPTNDLDIPTLEVLENSLKDFPGAIVIISHDRYMLDQISNLILGLGTQSDTILFADYRQWEQFQELNQKKDLEDSKEKAEKKGSVKEDNRPKKMTYNEKREWEQMEGKITELEKEISDLHTKTTTPSNQTSSQSMQEIYKLLADKQKILDDLYHRWQELESKL